MRFTLIVFLLMLLALVGYAYNQNPAGCAKVGNDLILLFQPSSEATPAPAVTSYTPSAVPATNVMAAVTPPPAAPVTNAPPVVAAPEPPPWKPPAVLPAQPNWTWTMLDGKTYDNVVVTKVEADMVSITHAYGVAHIPIEQLPHDLQMQLNYDPQAAQDARSERRREEEHPYYALADLAQAQKAARQLHWPLAWICSDLATLNAPNPAPGSDGALTQSAVNRLKTGAVVVFLNDNAELIKAPPYVLNLGYYQFDEGAIPGGHHFYSPKVVFSDPEGIKVYGRVTHDQLLAMGDAALDQALDAIANGTPVPLPTAPK